MKQNQKVIILTFFSILIIEICSEKNVLDSNKHVKKGREDEIVKKHVSQNDYGLMYHNEVEVDFDNNNQPKIVKSKKNKKTFKEDDLQNLFKSKKNKKKKKKRRKKKGSDYNDNVEENDDDEDVEEIIIVNEPKPIIQGCKMIHE